MLASFKMAHVVLKIPYTELEAVILPFLKIVADLIHGGKEAVDKVSKISLSDTTVYRRCQSIATDLEDQLIEKLKQAPLFAIQLDETTYVQYIQKLNSLCFVDLLILQVKKLQSITYSVNRWEWMQPPMQYLRNWMIT